jgi:protein-tyrosine phosphatase
VLFELSTFSAPLGIEEIIFELISSGYQPVLAHPERYIYLDIKAISKLKNIGCLLQSNLLSYNGFYGLNIKLKAWDIFDHGLCDYAGTDLHNQIQLTALEKMSQNYSLMLKLSSHKWKNSYL